MIEYWYIGFLGDHPEREPQWFDILTCKDFRHALALGYDPLSETWVSYEASVMGAFIELYPKGSPAVAALIAYVKDRGRWLRVEPRQARFYTGCWRLYCVTTIKMLVGLKSCALLPKGLYRDLVKAGAVPAFEKEDHGNTETVKAEGSKGHRTGIAEAA